MSLAFNVVMVGAIVVFHIDVFCIIIAIISITINVATLQIPSKTPFYGVKQNNLFIKGGLKNGGGRPKPNN